MTEVLIVGIVVVGFLAALFLIQRITAQALEAASRRDDTTATTEAVSAAVVSAASSVGDAVARALAPPPVAEQEPAEPRELWQDETGAFDEDLDDGFAGMVGDGPSGPGAVLGDWAEREGGMPT
jgi:hypothetical protein